MKNIFSVFLLLYTIFSFSQGEANIWYFGENAGLDFNSGSAVAINNGNLNTIEGCSSFSTSSGELLFYSDGTTIWNKNHVPMPNGMGLAGDESSSQSAMIIPKPSSTSIYYIFTVGSAVDPGKPGFNYYTIDMTKQKGLGDVISGPVDLTEGRAPDWTEKVAAIKGEECNTFWVVSYIANEFYAYKVTNTGVAAKPKKSIVGYNATDRRGYLKISPDGTKLAIAHMRNSGPTGSTAGSFFLYDFDKSTGDVTNQKKLNLIAPQDRPYGVEFSSNSEKLYVHASNDFYSNDPGEANDPSKHLSSLYQFDLSTNSLSAINSSRKIIDTRNLYRGALQLGPDQKIYRTLSKTYNIGIPFLGVIENPENDGIDCNYKHEEINLNGRNSTQGLPPFIASIFSQVKITNVENGTIEVLNDMTVDLCSGNDFNVELEVLSGNTVSSIWYKDGSTIPHSTDPNLSFKNLSLSDSGTYSLVITQKDKCGITSVLEGEFSIKVYESPNPKDPLSIKECDTDQDGFLTFNLKDLKDSELLNGQSTTDFEVTYFSNQADADSNITANSITGLYTNLSAFSNDLLFARIHNKNNIDCYETKSFNVHVFETPNPPTNISVLGKCDSNNIGTDIDGFEIFDLTEKQSEILNGQSETDFTISYYTNSSFNSASEITNPTKFSNTASTQTIYVKIENNFNSNCTNTTNFPLEVYELPKIVPAVSLKQCDNDTDGFSTFNLTEVNSKISSNSTIENFTYFKSFNGADNNISSDLINTPTAYINATVTTNTVWCRIENSNGCHRVAEINLTVSTTGIPSTFLQREYYECDDYVDSLNNERDGVTSFNFSDVTDDVIKELNAPGQQLIIKYYRSEADALSETNPILDPSNYRNIGYDSPQIIHIRIDSQLDNDCLGIWPRITLNVEKVPFANEVSIQRECDDDFDGIFNFDTSLVHSTVLNGQTGMVISYFDENGNSLGNSLPNPFPTKTQTITIRVTDSSSIDPDGSCYSETTLDFIVDTKPVANPVPNIFECDDDDDGILNIDTSLIEEIVLKDQVGMIVSYFDELGNSLPSPLPNPFSTTSQTITIKVENELNTTCLAETTLQFKVYPKPEFELDDTAIYCLNLPPILVKTYNALDDYTYEWKNESGNTVSTNSEAFISSAGEYTVIATSKVGCTSFPRTIIIEGSSIASLFLSDVTVIDDSDNNSITIDTTNLGIGDYEFAIQKENEFIGFYQDEPYFDNLSPGIYTIFIQDKNDCGVAELGVSVVGFPKFFTPNNDGSNDTWKVLGVNENFYGASDIYIFDRYGKLITQINPNSEGWDGTLNGRNLPSTDYWFSVKLIDNIGNIRIRKGHFSLIR